jgi:hypothetical protein
MKFKGHAHMASSPGMALDAKLGPIGFESALSGALELSIGAIVAGIDEFPVRLAIPFLKRRGGPVVVATLGGFKARVKPVSAKVGTESLHVKGTIGIHGIEGRLEAQAACKTDMDVHGQVGGRLGSVALNLGSDEDDFEPKQSA